eukprot:97973_1
MLPKTSLLIGLAIGIPIGYITHSYASRNIDKNPDSNDKSDALKSQLYTMAKYNEWAMNQVNKWCKTNIGSDIDKYTQNTEIPFKTIENTLCHLWMTDQVWYNRMFGLKQSELKSYKNNKKIISNEELSTYWIDGHENDGKFNKFFDEMSIDEIFDVLIQSNNKWIDVIESFDNDKQALDIFTYYHRSGTTFKQKKANVITHVMNHATHHRGQISAAATILCPDAKPIQL